MDFYFQRSMKQAMETRCWCPVNIDALDRTDGIAVGKSVAGSLKMLSLRESVGVSVGR